MGERGGRALRPYYDPNPTFWAFSRVMVLAQPAVCLGRGSWRAVVEDRLICSLRGHGSICRRGGSWWVAVEDRPLWCQKICGYSSGKIFEGGFFHPENIKGGGFGIFTPINVWVVGCLKNNPGALFSDIRRRWRQLFICLAEGHERSSTHVCLAAEFLEG